MNPIYVVTEWTAYDGGDVEKILTNEAEARRLWEADEALTRRWRETRATRPTGVTRDGGTSVVQWTYDPSTTQYERTDWPLFGVPQPETPKVEKDRNPS